MLLFANGLDIFPHAVDLRLPGLAIDEEVVVGLFLVPPTPPAFVRRDLSGLVAEIVSGRRAHRQELVVSAHRGLSLVGDFLPKLFATVCTRDAVWHVL